MIGYILAKAGEIALDLVQNLLTSPLGWVIIAVFFFLHTQGIYTVDALVGDLSLVFWESILKPLFSAIEQLITDFIQGVIKDAI